MRWGSGQIPLRRRALTLVECLVASFLLAIGASAVMVAMSAGLQNQKYAHEERVATELAKQLLEHVKALAYIHPNDPDFAAKAPSAAQGMDGYTDTVDATGQPAAGADSFSRALTIKSSQHLGLSAIPGAGVATAQITTPSGQVVQLTQLLPVR